MTTLEEYLVSEAYIDDSRSAQGSRKRSGIDIGEGIFSMDFITQISTMKDIDIEKAKDLATAKIENSSATTENKESARMKVNDARNIDRLVITMSNISMKFQGLGVM